MTPALAFATVVVAAGVLVLSVLLVGRVAAAFGQDPRRWQLLMLPFTVFGPFVAWIVLSRRGGGGGRGDRWA